MSKTDKTVLRVVLDPGVLVSALITPIGTPAAILRATLTGHLEIIASPHLLAELASVLTRGKFRRYVSLDETAAYVEALAHRVELHPDPTPKPGATRDPNDDYLVALAQETNADAIVSGDADLLTADTHPLTVTPRELLERIQG